MSRPRRVARRVGILATWLLGLLAAVMVAAVVAFYSLSDVPRPDTLPLAQVAGLYYSDGTLMAKIGSVNRTVVPISRVPVPVRYDVLAAEDRGFYDEPGVSIRGTLRAALSDATGGDTQGGSGITQQYVKNAYLSDSRTLSRKLKELAIAVKLSREYSKNQILEYYLNTVYFGRGAYGIDAGAHAFFGTSIDHLDVAQGAVLAALLRAPTYYDPANNPRAARARWRYVLQGMVTTGHLTQARANAMRYPKVIAPRNGNGLGVNGPRALIVRRVLAELQSHGISESEVYARGLRIRTTINHSAQTAAVKAVSSTFGNLTKAQRNMKNALVAVNPKTGGVLAYYGGSGPGRKDYAGKIDYNDYAGVGSAAPGSSFKPYTLATALNRTLADKNTLTVSSIVDGSFCKTIEGTKICNDPSDAGYSSSAVSVANAMKYSLNTTFDQMAADVGPARVAATAHAMGVSKRINGKPSLAGANGKTAFSIGIGGYAVHPIDQAVGFATLADGGVANSPYLVERAVGSDGALVYQHKADPHRALNAKVANDVTLTLEPIAAFTGTPLADDRMSAAKTGTEGIQSSTDGANSDAWMVGYTPQVAAAVWVGSGNATDPIVNSYGQPEYGRDLPARTWQAFMDDYLGTAKNLPLATQQEVFPGGADGTAPTSHPPSSTYSAPSSTASSPSPTFSITTGFPSPSSPTTPPSSPQTTPSTPQTTPTTPKPSKSTTSSSNCGGLLQSACPNG